ncbi:hypothetical protein CDCA_CDCA20G4797 [Cyanidium caldarium]|uniref:NADH dehydrogenase [ubiquinone] 1 beta subcomplex subunit 7 n=1 Tax=Cyanidium caldarium TaxID=2771 RepID=A0AAV9J2E6_CYACA|nr:hypothetical protein CDCA_CDCA20G4797 [Cyanidium caldarium]
MSERANPYMTDEELAAHEVSPLYRDVCAHLLIPLNKCRRLNWYLPWKCTEARHAYEKCQYENYKRRLREKAEQRRHDNAS